MKKVLFLLMLSLLVGCEKKKEPRLALMSNMVTPPPADTPAPNAPTPPAKPAPTIPGPYTGAVKTGPFLFIAAGQSNMSGDGQNPIFESHPRIHIMSGNRTGSGYAFALAFVTDNPDAEVYLVNCAIGGTSIEQWERGGGLYQTCLSYAGRSHLPVSALLFFQGEANAQSNIDPYGWKVKFLNMVDSFRSDLHNPNLPVVFAQIGENLGNTAPWEIVKRVQEVTTGYKMAMVTTDDLPYYEGVHFTGEAYRVIGYRMARALYRL